MGLLQPIAAANAKFKEVGDTYSGVLTKVSEEQQATVYDGVRGVPTNEPDFWDKDTKQRPKMQIYVTLECQPGSAPAHFDFPEDGVINVWATVQAKQGGMYSALVDQLKHTDRLGGVLTVQYVGNDPASRNPANPRKLFTATYVEPPLLGGGAPAPAQQPVASAAPAQQVQQPAQQQVAPAPAPAQAPAAGQIPAQPPAGSGVDADTWARMPAATQQAIIAGLQQTGGQPPY